MTNYVAASGEVVRMGGFPPMPSWVASAQATSDTWVTLPGTNFRAWALANMPGGAYIGTDPIGAIVDAYCDPATHTESGVLYQDFFGGGHGDGSNNAVVRFNWSALQYGMLCLPTPTDKYPRDYGVDRLLPANSPPGSATQPGPLRYANGATPNFFDPNPVHGAYSAPFLARQSTHMYDTATYCSADGRIYYPHNIPAKFNTATGQWDAVSHVDYGAQLFALSSSFGTGGFNTQCAFKYDPVNDKLWGTLVPGDGSGNRWHMVRINRVTETIEAAIPIGTSMLLNGNTLCVVGRWLYSFKPSQTTFSAPATYDTGFRILMDAPYTVEAIACTGVATPPNSIGGGFEVLPSTYDQVGHRIVRANYTVSSNTIYEIDPTPVSGAGTLVDPRLLTQTSRTLSNSLGVAAAGVYSRAVFFPGTRVLCLLPRGDSLAHAVALS